MAILKQVKEAMLPVAPAWVEAAMRGKQIPAGAPFAGEEQTSGP